jgi:hypothetical protein
MLPAVEVCMFRLTLLLLATAPVVLAQNNCSPSCSKMEFTPISGRVLNAATGQPIAGARVHYRGNGGSFGGDDNHELDPITLQGEVTTAIDGSYTLPDLPPGTFSVRASAPGFLAAKDYLQPLPVGFKPQPHPLPPGYKGPPPHAADGVFKLNPNTLDLKTRASVQRYIETFTIGTSFKRPLRASRFIKTYRALKAAGLCTLEVKL